MDKNYAQEMSERGAEQPNVIALTTQAGTASQWWLAFAAFCEYPLAATSLSFQVIMGADSCSTLGDD